jgi:3-oxoacyl-[acyl-carrier-protein] synthase III
MKSVIMGSGIALPPHIVTNDQLSEIMDTSDEWIRTRSGIEQRYYAAPGQGSADLGTEAARAALADAGVEPKDIDAVVFATMTPDFQFPSNGPLLQAALGLANVPTFDLRQQCSGFLYGLELVDVLLRSGRYHRILLVGAECHSPFMPWRNAWDRVIGLTDREATPEEKAANTLSRDRTVLFGDAGGAVVMEARDDDSKGLLATRLHTDGTGVEALMAPGVGFRKRPMVTHEDIDSGAIIPIMKGREVFKQAVTLMPEAVRGVCSDAGVAVEDLGLVLVHQANLRIVEGVQKALGLPADKVPHNIEKYGNTTAGTLPLLYHECVADGRIKPGMLLAFTALGSGLHWGAALYRC